MSLQKIEMLPCPDCGQENDIDTSGGFCISLIVCTACHALLEIGYSIDDGELELTVIDRVESTS